MQKGGIEQNRTANKHHHQLFNFKVKPPDTIISVYNVMSLHIIGHKIKRICVDKFNDAYIALRYRDYLHLTDLFDYFL